MLNKEWPLHISPTHTHDTILFAKGTSANIQTIVMGLNLYSSLLAQDINLDKSHIYFGFGISAARQTSFMRITDMR